MITTSKAIGQSAESLADTGSKPTFWHRSALQCLVDTFQASLLKLTMLEDEALTTTVDYVDIRYREKRGLNFFFLLAWRPLMST
jgi:hypothetical protein